MSTTRRVWHSSQFAVRISQFAIVALLVSACLPAGVPIGPMPTVTPRPTATPAPPTSTPRPTDTPQPTSTPRPTATPRPVGIAVWDGAPAALAAAVGALLRAQPETYYLEPDAQKAALQIAPRLLPDLGQQRLAGEQVLVPVVPFPTLADGVDFAEVRAFWAGKPDALAQLGDGAHAPALYVVTGTLQALTALLGAPAKDAPVRTVAAEALSDRVWAARPGAWAIVGFDELEPRLKALRVDGQSVFDKQLDVATYALRVSWYANGPARALDALQAQLGGRSATNRDVARLTVLAMTGVTAPSRHMMEAIEAHGDVTWPAAEVGPLLRAADITHVSNEVALFDDCPLLGSQLAGALCGRASYMGLLEAVGADVIELSGNHMNDYGRKPFSDTLQLYSAAGMRTFAGGQTLADARTPLIMTANGNRIAFLGCNLVGPPQVFATDTDPGAMPCDYGVLFPQLEQLHAQHQADVVVFTYQYLETDATGGYSYTRTDVQRRDFRVMADRGADIVSGSQAHQPQGFSFTADGRFISYGLGNLFFDQMFSLGTRQGLIERHVIYAGRHISTELVTILNYDYGQPHLTTGDDRAALLSALFAASDW